jgi:RNA-directed DNA polymerase
MQAQKAHSLIGQVYDRRNLRRAWERVKKNKGAGGVDGVTIARFEKNLDHYLDVLHRQLQEGRYRPRPVRRVEIDKPGTTKKRPLGIPTVSAYGVVVQRGFGFAGRHASVPSAARRAAWGPV